MATKSSSDILNELFSTYNATFDDPEESSSDSSSSSSSNDDSKSKKKKKKKVKRSKSESDKKDKEKRSKKDKDRKSKKVKDKDKAKKDKSSKAKSKEGSAGKEEDPKFKPTTIVLDIEDGEILDEEEKALRKSAKKKREAKDVKEDSPSKKRSKRKSGESRDQIETEKDIKRSTSSSNKHKHEADYEKSRRRSRSPAARIDSERRRSSHSTSSSHRDRNRHSSVDDGYRDRDRDRDSSARRAPPREKENDRYGHDRHEYESSSSRSSSYYKTNWQKASTRDTSYASDRTYSYHSHDSRRSYNYNDYDSSRSRDYGVARSGFGYSGSRKYDDEYDDYYDYKRSGRYSSRRGRSRSRSRSRTRDPEDVIDKAKLLEIARRNAAKLMKKGCLPTDIFSRDQILAIRAGGKSVEELTEYCQKLAEKDARGDLKDDGSSSEDEHFINHPFQVKDRPLPSIVMNIRNAIPLPVRSPHELALENAKLKVQFPVSSGTRHRYKELEWRPVEEDEKEKSKSSGDSKSLVPVDGPKVGTVAPMPKAITDGKEADDAEAGGSSGGPLAITAGPGAEDEKSKPKTFAETTINSVPKVTVDISELISMRLRAMRRLEEDPDDTDAKEELELATMEMKNWAEAKALEPKFLTQAEIIAGPQAWVRKDQLQNTTELKSGMGLHLLQKMGWKPGEGLGKNKEGPTTPLALEIKMDKKGLSSSADYPERNGPQLPNVFDLSGKHPVSSLMELCMKRKWGQPTFELCFEHGPAHKKNFVYKVTVNGVEYQPCIATNNKKLAKAQSAAFCLQSLGLLPTTGVPRNKKAASMMPNQQPKTSLLKPAYLQTVPTPTPPSTDPTPTTSEPLPVPPPLPPDAEQSSLDLECPPPPPPPPAAPAQRKPKPSASLPRPRPLFAGPLLPNPRFQQRNAMSSRPPRPPLRNTFTPLLRPPMYATPTYRVARNSAPRPGLGFTNFNSTPSYQSFDSRYSQFGEQQHCEQPMQQMQIPKTGVYMQAAQNLVQSAFQPQFHMPVRPAPRAPPQQQMPPEQTYSDVPQVQVPLPQESGFPGLITF